MFLKKIKIKNVVNLSQMPMKLQNCGGEINFVAVVLREKKTKL